MSGTARDRSWSFRLRSVAVSTRAEAYLWAAAWCVGRAGAVTLESKGKRRTTMTRTAVQLQRLMSFVAVRVDIVVGVLQILLFRKGRVSVSANLPYADLRALA